MNDSSQDSTRYAPCAPSPWLTIAQARAYLHMRNGEFRKLIRSGEIPSVRRGRATLVHAQDLDAWMQRQPSGAAPIATAMRSLQA
jgi:excisionase family DNA binding protein